MNMTPEMIPAVEWIPCQNGLPSPGTFVWIVVGKVIESGVARRYPREVHMGVFQEEGKFQIYPYKTPILSNQVWAWAPMVPPSAPLCKSRDPHKGEGEEWREEISDDDIIDGEDDIR